ncbi:succinate dehydrogenase assembly factor 3, mitochondrial [Euwallacea fornicatus]|uniref:succinate dehydrogenase assembly factor 3, mitochondrial n=1 Tax=Euwallacea fornicatus TaxID=995702 RepID=UPI00338E8C80
MPHAHNVRTLYKLILRLHRGLPEELQFLGTKYTQDEFKRHKNCAPHEAAVFMREWSNYAIMLAQQLGATRATNKAKFGQSLPVELLDHLRDEQILQLYELMEATRAPKESTKEE